MSAIERTAPMDSATETSPSTAVPICTQAGGVGNVAMSKDVDKKEKKKRKAVRRDPEKRRKQNSQAQKKYSEVYQMSSTRFKAPRLQDSH